MTDLNYLYIGKPVNLVIQEIEKQGYNAKVFRTRGHKDKDILKDEIVISVKKEENTVLLITSFFKINID